MTGRDFLTRRKRIVTMVAVCGFLVAGAAAVLGPVMLGAAAGGEAGVVALGGFGIAFLTTMYAQFRGFPCPWCRGNLAPLAFRRLGMSFDSRVKFCPYCGREIDDEVTGSGEGDEPDREDDWAA